VNFGVDWWLSAVRFREWKGNTTATRGFIHATECVLRMRTSERGPASKQLRSQARGGDGCSGSAPAAEHPPLLEHCSELYPTNSVVLQNSPKF